MCEFYQNSFRGAITHQQTLIPHYFIAFFKGVIISIGGDYFQIINDWGSYFSQVYYDLESHFSQVYNDQGSYYFGGVNIHRCTRKIRDELIFSTPAVIAGFYDTKEWALNKRNFAKKTKILIKKIPIPSCVHIYRKKLMLQGMITCYILKVYCSNIKHKFQMLNDDRECSAITSRKSK